MNARQIEANVESLMGSWSKDTFIYELLLAYGLPKATVTRAMKGTANMSKERGVVQLKSKVLFKPVQGQDLHVSVEHAAKQATHKERFVIVTDFKTLLAKDMSGKATPLETPFEELHKHYAYFLPWAGLEKTAVVNENPADRKAAEKLARLYDDLREANNVESDAQRHALNVFLTRLLFCFFAEDTGIFEDGQFSVGMGSHTADDGNDSSDYLRRLFSIMGTPEDMRESLPQHLAAFPFVGESLFGDDLPVPDITRRGRSTILAAGDLDWAAINPDIFGSMIQAVVSEENRGELGMHYTSVPNIMKVIGPLFLDELHEEFDKAQGSATRLRKLLYRIHNLHILDPACGSGNFLITTYRELRMLEMKILKQFNELPISGIRLNHFHGIEIDGFAHETAKLSMWFAELLMNKKFEEEMGQGIPPLPLVTALDVVRANAASLDWNSFFSGAEEEVYVIGNPPFLGSRNQLEAHKKDLDDVCREINGYRSLDYVAIWMVKGVRFLNECTGAKGVAFVATNSICQGRQIPVFWPWFFRAGAVLNFAYQSFRWTNNARDRAVVSVVILGFSREDCGSAQLFTQNSTSNVKGISPYLTAGAPVVVKARSTPISALPSMVKGSMPTDDGEFLVTKEEFRDLVQSGHDRFVYPYVGAVDLLASTNRRILKISDDELGEAKKSPVIADKLDRISAYRASSKREATRKFATCAHRYTYDSFRRDSGVGFACISSSRREYLPLAVVPKGAVSYATIQIIYNCPLWVFALIISKIHLVWVRLLAGRMKDDLNYSSTICYNTFPFSAMSKQKEEELAMCALRILEVRERYPDRTLAELYDPDKMPEDLLEAHRHNDKVVEMCYRARPFESDEDRLQVLFDLYAKMTAEEADKGSLFESPKTKKKRKRHA